MRRYLCAILLVWSTIAFAAVETCTLTLYSDGCSTPNTFTFLKGSSTTITAEAKYGYRFKRWSDGYTNNPRNITVNSDVSYTAIYECITDTITVASQGCNEVNTFIFLRGTQTTLTPVARYGYKFVKWTDGYKDNPRTITVNGNATYTAVFTSNMDTITLASQGCEEVNTFVLLRGTRTTLTPTPRYGYKFVRWADGYTDNPRTITTNGNAIYTAVFEEVAPDLRTILLYADGCETPDTFNCAYNMLRSFEAIPEEHYHFVRWNDNNQDNPRTINVTSNASYTAFFDIDQHTISFVDEDGTTLQTSDVEYGQVPAYNSATPTKPATGQYTYTFAGWSPEVVAVTGAATYTATYSSTTNSYLITFINYDGTTLQSGNVNYGATPTYTGATPTKPATAQYTYTFKGWDKEIVSVVGVETYTAQFDSVVNKYTIAFVDEDGTILQTSEVEYGQVPAYNSATPTKAATAQYTYAFAGWTPEVVAVTAAATYTATYSSTINSYLITFANYDGTTLQSGNVNYGVTPTYTGTTPTKPATAQYTYTFKGWDKELVSVVGSETYTAQFDSVVNKYTISFVDEDGTPLQTSEVEYGQIPAYNGTAPSKSATAQYTYTFSGWSPEVVAVTAAATYTATYSSTVNKYTITVIGENCTISGEGTYDYSTEVTLSVTPDEGYWFVQWSDGVTEVTRQIVVTEDATYNAIVEVIETGLHDNTLSEKATKIYDGYNYYILRGGRRYTMQGQEVR